MADYKKTLNLPQTKFPMKADLVNKEPDMLKFWEEIDAFSLMMSVSGQNGDYLFHDGPPYANGSIHLGTALNKVLKDIIIKSRNLLGWRTNYIPGWDCHGLPIEHKIELELKEKKKELPQAVVRKMCRAYADKYLSIQRKEFKRLGVLGLWDKPYITMDPVYESVTAAELATFVENGQVVRSKKPIYWCSSCKTALAEAEVEYKDHTSPSIFVRFPLPDQNLRTVFPKADPALAHIVIWTTTPWTIPDNLGVAVHPDFIYVLVQAGGAQYVLARELLEKCAKIFGWPHYEILNEAEGKALDGLKARHPFYDRESLVILGEHVTLDAGSGSVHTAPGHGREDYEVGLKYGLDIYSPLDDQGRFLPSVEYFAGLNVFEANPVVIAKLEEVGNLLAKSELSHSYPHCWRCKKPVIFRATTQWFISMDSNDLRQKTLNAIRNDVRWVPAWGEERIYGMIESRPDWCISRQRLWGVPILALLCQDCGEAWNDPVWMREIAGRFASHPTGCDYWYETEVADLAPADLRCPRCGGQHWKKESDILDVWFDSGSSFAAVMEKRPEGGFPIDLYLEGSDQHRGWFHSSLLISVANRGRAPYRTVLTHGYVVDGQGCKQSKSLGNVVAPQEVIDKYGAELLRLWVSSVDYREDIRYSDEIMNRLVDAYRRIRNTCRYLLGSIHDLEPADLVPATQMLSLDRFVLDLTLSAHEKIEKAYLDFEFHKVFHTLHNLCAADLSAFYLDVLKDRLYSSLPDSRERRSAQTALYHILLLILRDMAPVLSFSAEEAFRHLPEKLRPLHSGRDPVLTVLAAPAPAVYGFSLSEEQRQAWRLILDLRAEVTRAIEPLRKDGVLGHSLDARVDLYLSAELFSLVRLSDADLRSTLIVSNLALGKLEEAGSDSQACELEGLRIRVSRAPGDKCERCWIYSENLGVNPAYPTLCPRCATVMHELDSREKFKE